MASVLGIGRNFFLGVISDLLAMLYPPLCAGCGEALATGEEEICVSCRFELPKTNFHLEKENPVAKLFWGRVPVESASSYLYFQKKGITQKLLHQLKYKGQKEVGRKLGLYYGYDLKQHLKADCIIPIPLHKSRLRTRGYNQSEWFGKGLSEAMGIPMDSSSVVRIRKTETQTRKGRYKRWENVEGIFAVKDPGKLSGCHVLLVDDVVTTGATLEACAQALVKAVEGVRVSVVTIAVA